MRGYIQVYTGNGKGKTTAAFGLALRAAGAGIKVFIAQFVKGMYYSELNSFKLLDELISLQQYGRKCFILDKPEEADVKIATDGLKQAEKAINSGDYGLVILDEANIATYYNLFSVERLLYIIKHKPAHVEIVITGRNADKKIIQAADLVTEMLEIKHYYQKGIEARLGIEN